MYWAQYFHVYVWMVIVCGFCKASQCIANQLSIIGGDYQISTYSNSFVIRETSYTGPKGCIKECLYQYGCDAVNYKTSHTCELLSTMAGDEKWTKQYSFFSEIADWKMVIILSMLIMFIHSWFLASRTKKTKKKTQNIHSEEYINSND